MKKQNLLWGLLLFPPIFFSFIPSFSSLNEIKEYLPLHTFLETSAIIVAMMIFGIGWTSRNKKISDHMILITCIFFAVGIFDFMHTITYPQMPDVIQTNDHNRDLWFWIIGRFVCSLGLLLVALSANQIKLFSKTLLPLFIATIVFVFSSSYIILFNSGLLPVLYSQETGLTTLKKYFEYSILIISFIAAYYFWKQKDQKNNIDMYTMFQAAMLVGVSELFFTTYLTLATGLTIVGHIYKTIAYLYLYKAIVVSTIEYPYSELKKTINDLDISLDASHTGLWYWDIKTNKVNLSKAWKEQLGYIEIKTDVDFNFILEIMSDQDRAKFEIEIYSYLGNGLKDRFEFEYRLKNSFGDYSTILLKGIKVYDDKHNVVTFIGAHVDISEIKEKEKNINYLANYDIVTELPNRNMFYNTGSKIIDHAQENEYFSLLILDIDNFKNINDTLTHQIGDQLLTQLGHRLIKIVGPENFVARVGGDEFVVILKHNAHSTNITSHEGYVKSVSEEIMKMITHSFFIEGNEINLTSSMGISTFPTDSKEITELMQFSDMAMHEAKNQGKNTYVVFNTELSKALLFQHNLQKNLAKAIINDELFLVFQPQFDTSNLQKPKLIGFETLIRWQSKEMGFVSPGEFIPMAERTGLIIDIGNWIFENVCSQMASWRALGLKLVPISINISPIQLKHSHLLDFILTTIDKYSIPAELIELELTEGAMMEDPAASKQLFYKLKKMGFKLLIDDFGTGYSSLSYLKEFDIYKLKIDQSFVRNIHLGKADCSIIKAIINISENLNFKVIAEGVETKEEMEFLHAHGCKEVQGYLLGKPMKKDDAEKVLQSHQ